MDVSYQPMTLADLARLVAAEADFDSQWRLVVEFLKEYHQEPARDRLRLLEDTPGPAAFRSRGVFVADYEIDAA
jgi:hypothetical protein